MPPRGPPIAVATWRKYQLYSWSKNSTRKALTADTTFPTLYQKVLDSSL